MKPTQSDVLLELHVPDFEKAKKFYGRLGFKVVWERKPDEFKGYIVMKRQNSILCFWGGNEFIYKHPTFKKYPNTTKRGYGIEIIVPISNIEKFYKQVEVFANVVEPLIVQPWGLKDFRIEDPFGFYIRFTESHDVLNRKFAVK